MVKLTRKKMQRKRAQRGGGLNEEQLKVLNDNINGMIKLLEESKDPKTTFDDVIQELFNQFLLRIRKLASGVNEFESLIQIKSELEDIERLSKIYMLTIDQLDGFITHLFSRAKKMGDLPDGWGADWSEKESGVYYFPIKNRNAPSQWEKPTAAAAGGRRRRGRKTTGRSRKTTGRSRKTTGRSRKTTGRSRKTRGHKKH